MSWTYHATDAVESCNLCQSGPDQWTTIATRDRSGFLARSVACRNCGLVFITPRMSAQAYSEFYASGAYRQTVEKLTGKPFDFANLLKSQEFYARSMSKWLAGKVDGRGKRLLDIGGSTGVVADIVGRQFGFDDITVLEPSVGELAQAEARGLKCELGSLETWEPGDRQWDFVTLWQTSDHLLDVSGSLSRIRRLLTPHGLFAVDIVNYAFLLCGLRRRSLAAKIDHPFGFTQPVMESFLQRAGFEIISTLHMNDARIAGVPKKVFFLCRSGPVRTDLPDSRYVEDFLSLIRATPE